MLERFVALASCTAAGCSAANAGKTTTMSAPVSSTKCAPGVPFRSNVTSGMRRSSDAASTSAPAGGTKLSERIASTVPWA